MSPTKNKIKHVFNNSKYKYQSSILTIKCVKYTVIFFSNFKSYKRFRVFVCFCT